MLQLFSEHKALRGSTNPGDLTKLLIIEAKLVKMNMGLLYMTARKYSLEVPREDLVQSGVIGLLHAIRNFDVDRGIKFSAYAWNHLRNYNSMQGEAFRENSVHVPYHVRCSTLKELKDCGYDEEKISDECRAALAASSVASIDMEMTGMEGVSVVGCIEQETYDSSEDLAYLRETADLINDAINSLTERERIVILNNVMGTVEVDPMGLREVKELVGVSHEMVRKIRNKALEKLRKKLVAEYGPSC